MSMGVTGTCESGQGRKAAAISSNLRGPPSALYKVPDTGYNLYARLGKWG